MRPDSVPLPLKDVSAAILAGGRSTRFGAPKSLAPVGTGQLIDYSVRLARDLASEQYAIVSPYANWISGGVRAYFDLIQDSGPLGGIYTALTVSTMPWVAVIPGDMPLLRADIYALLYAGRTDARPVVAQSEHGLEPLVSLWPVSIQAALADAIQAGQLALSKLLPNLGAKVINIPNHCQDSGRHLFLNINTPEDYAFFLQLTRG